MPTNNMRKERRENMNTCDSNLTRRVKLLEYDIRKIDK